MKIQSIASVIALSVLLASCGGEGSPSAPPVLSQPTPTPTPTPSPSPVAGTNDRIVYSTSQSGQLAGEGRYWTDGGLTVNFESGTGFYFAADPGNTTPGVIGRMPGYTPLEGQPWRQFLTANGVYITAFVSGQPNFPQDERYLHSNLLSWTFKVDSNFAGVTAIGIPTIEGAGPSTGSTVYRGPFYILSDQLVNYEGQMVRDGIEGLVELHFDASGNSAHLSILPRPQGQAFNPVSANPISIVWTRAAATFFQADPSSSTSKNYPVSGRFTGPAAEELIGGLRFNYVSPVDGKTYEARGAFIAKR